MFRQTTSLTKRKKLSVKLVRQSFGRPFERLVEKIIILDEHIIMQGKKVYFLSDAHLGAKLLKDNREREIMLVEFLQKHQT